MYHNLMSDDYKEFLLHNKKLLLNSPHIEKNSLDKIQKFLNRKMEIDAHNDNNNNNTEIKEKKKDEKNKIKRENSN